MTKVSIRKLIYREYQKAALIPIVVIELALLVLYFGITGYLEQSSTDLLDKEASRNLGEIVTREARNIDTQLENVATLSGILQKENTRYFTQPERRTKPSVAPKFAVAPNGAYYKTADNGGAALWYSAGTVMGPEQKAKATATEAFDPLFQTVVEADKKIVAVYFNTNDSMCRYYPWLPEVYTLFDPATNVTAFNFYYLADAAHNPKRLPVWTPAYLDPAGQGWMASCVAPIYNGEVLEGVTGIDITIDSIIKNVLDLKLPWGGSAFLVDDAGVIIAMPAAIEELLGLKELKQQVYHSAVKEDTVKPEEFNLFKNKDTAIADQFRAIFSSGQLVNEFSLGTRDFLLTNSRIQATGWHTLILVDKAAVRAPIVVLDQLTKQFGLIALITMLVFYTVFFSLLLYRSRRVAERMAMPISALTSKSSDFRSAPATYAFKSEASDIDEIDQLSVNFEAMATELSGLYSDLDAKVKQRTLELEAANDELSEAYQQIAQQDKMASIGQLAAGVAHEINNPMSFIKSNVETMQDAWSRLTAYLKATEKGNLSEAELRSLREQFDLEYLLHDGPQLFHDTLEGTNRVKAIVAELSSFARTSASVEAADLNNLLEGVLKISASELKNRIELVLNLDKLPLIRCIPGQISQVFLNLLVNALQATPDRGRIEVTSAVVEDAVKVTVSDSGTGMSRDVMSRVFEPFFTTKKVGEGTGLGLSVSYAIVKQHGGRIEVQSELGRGSKFSVWLPLVRA